MISAIVTVKRLTSCIVYDAIGTSSANIQASAEELYCDDEEVTVVDVIVI